MSATPGWDSLKRGLRDVKFSSIPVATAERTSLSMAVSPCKEEEKRKEM